MHDVRTFLQDLALVFCVAAVATVLFRRLKQPVVLGYLLAGIIVGPHVPIPLFADTARIHTLSELGVILVMFSIGLEFSMERLVRVLPTAGLAGLVQISGMIWLGYTVGRLFGWTWQESLVTGAMVCISSTMIVARVFADQRVDRRLSDIVFGILIIEDLAAVLLITVLITVMNGTGMEASMVVTTIGRLAGFLIALVVIGSFVVPRAIRAVGRLDNAETLLVASVGACFGLSLLAQKLGYSVALGAFVAGSLVGESGHRKQVEDLIAPVRDLFAAVFFVSVGMGVDPAAVGAHWAVVLVLTAVVVAGQIFFVSLGSFVSGQDVRTSVRAGMSLAQIGEFSFIIVGVGVASGAVGGFLQSVAVAVAVLTTFATPWLVRIAEPAALYVDRRLPRPLQTFVSLYGSWLEALRVRWARDSSPIRRLAAWLVIDASIITAIVVGVSLARPDLTRALTEHLGIPRPAGAALVLAGAALICLPFIIGVLRAARSLGAVLAIAALPQVAAGRVDLAAAPRKAFILALQLAIVLLVGVPVLAFTQPFLPPFYGALILLLLVSLLGIGFWRSTTNLEGHVRAGAQVVLEALERQRTTEEPLTQRLERLLPGLGPITPVRLAQDSAAQGQTLAQINLRGLTGANVIAIVRSDDGVVTPTGREVLEAGDVLVLSGTRQAIEAAALLLARTPSEAS